jgi:hypothetical protein
MASCGIGGTGGSAQGTTTMVRSGNLTEDQAFLSMISDELLGSADLRVKEEVIDGALPCTAHPWAIDEGRFAAITLVLHEPDEPIDDTMARVATALQEINVEHFESRGWVEVSENIPGNSAYLFAEGFELSINDSSGNLGLDASGPCRG